MACGVSVMKELHGLFRKSPKLFDGQVEFEMDEKEHTIDGLTETTEEDADAENVDDQYINLYFYITPNGGLYKNARIKFKMQVDTHIYPDQAPNIICLNSIYHPNINWLGSSDLDYEDGADICVNLLDSDWEPEVGLDGCVMAVLFLFYNPQIDDTLSTVCHGLEDWDEFASNVYQSLRGEKVDDFEFDKLLEPDEDKTENNTNPSEEEESQTKVLDDIRVEIELKEDQNKLDDNVNVLVETNALLLTAEVDTMLENGNIDVRESEKIDCSTNVEEVASEPEQLPNTEPGVKLQPKGPQRGLLKSWYLKLKDGLSLILGRRRKL